MSWKHQHAHMPTMWKGCSALGWALVEVRQRTRDTSGRDIHEKLHNTQHLQQHTAQHPPTHYKSYSDTSYMTPRPTSCACGLAATHIVAISRSRVELTVAMGSTTTYSKEVLTRVARDRQQYLQKLADEAFDPADPTTYTNILEAIKQMRKQHKKSGPLPLLILRDGDGNLIQSESDARDVWGDLFAAQEAGTRAIVGDIVEAAWHRRVEGQRPCL